MKRVFKYLYTVYLSMRWKLRSSRMMIADIFAEDYVKKDFSILKIHSIHKKGFTVSDWKSINTDTYKKYITSIQYYKMHPINGMFGKWIDDKLTLKYLCGGTKLDNYLPEYYYMIDDLGNILPLSDLKNIQNEYNVESILKLLENKKCLALKLLAGSIGKGFYRLELIENKYYLNGESKTYDEVIEEIRSLRNYLVTEYLFPHKDLGDFSEGTVNCIRYLVGKVNSDLIFIKSFIRFGTKASGYVENYNCGGVLCYVDEKGYFKEGNILKDGKNIIVHKHPDCNLELCGEIPMWKEIQRVVDEFGKIFPQLKYLGFDFVVTRDNQVKILEINSLTSLDALQLDESLLETSAKKFFEQYLE